MFQPNSSKESNCKPRRGRKKRKKDGLKCLVCGDPSIGINFGIHTCSPCKAFFRRNAPKLGTYEFVCEKDGDCVVNNMTRRNCNCCRLAKCFKVGMNRDAIRSENEKLKRNQLVEYNRHTKLQKTNQPVNLSNYFNNNESCLSSNDQELLRNIFNSYEQTCASLSYSKLLKMLNDNTLSLPKLMNSISYIYLSLVDYFKNIPEFSNLPVEMRIILLKTNLNQVFYLNNALIVHATGTNDRLRTAVFKDLFPDDLYAKICSCILALLSFVNDPIFLKLLSIILIFSTSLNVHHDNYQPIIDTKGVFLIQNFYIELLWRWILSHCSTYRESVNLLTSFIRCSLHSQIINVKLHEFVNTINPNNIDQLEPIMKAMWLNEKTE